VTSSIQCRQQDYERNKPDHGGYVWQPINEQVLVCSVKCYPMALCLDSYLVVRDTYDNFIILWYQI
jgi:hypothetical protein